MRKKHLVLALGAAAYCVSANCAERDKKPNVIIIYSDDQGAADLGCYGSDDIYSPNIDELARTGVRFTQFYAAPVSSASRANLLTGQFCRRAGLSANSGYHGFPSEKETLAERMRKGGYKTALIGKWHLGEAPDAVPTARGFDYFWGFLGGCIDNYSHFYYWGGPNRHDLWENEREIYLPGSFFIDESLHRLKSYVRRNNGDDPFFLYWGINIPHYPLQPTQKWLDYYSGLSDPRRMYAAFVSTMDEYVGKLMDFLKEEGLYEDTVIIFQSDNGHSTEDRTFGGGGSAGIYRGGKFSCFEGGIRVPSIISYPGHFPQGEVRDQMSMSIDWFPTLVELCEVDSKDMDVDGRSLMPVIKSASAPDPHKILHFDFLDQWAIRDGDWKLIYKAVEILPGNYRKEIEDEYFLSNLKTDPSEKSNLASKYPGIVEKLKAQRETFVAKCAGND